MPPLASRESSEPPLKWMLTVPLRSVPMYQYRYVSYVWPAAFTPVLTNTGCWVLSTANEPPEGPVAVSCGPSAASELGSIEVAYDGTI